MKEFNLFVKILAELELNEIETSDVRFAKKDYGSYQISTGDSVFNLTTDTQFKSFCEGLLFALELIQDSSELEYVCPHTQPLPFPEQPEEKFVFDFDLLNKRIGEINE